MSKMNSKPAEKVSEPKVPADLLRALATLPAAKAKWMDLTPIARRDFVSWIEGAKQPETRRRRIDRTPDMLSSGKRRPCCYAIVPMNLYKALAGMPKAKATWKDLTPTERRDIVSWVDGVKGSEARGLRIQEACIALAHGKRHP